VPEPAATLRLVLDVPEAAAELFAEALGGWEGAAAVAAFEAGPDAWRVEALLTRAPDGGALAARLALAAAAAGIVEPTPRLEPLPAADWLARNRESFRPLAIGPFQVRRPEHRARPGARAVLIEAATAFGTGEHATTKGCLLALAGAARRRRVGRVLDVGTGSGILAVAAARLGAAGILAIDIDPEAVRVARFHARLNGVEARVRLLTADGAGRAAVAAGGPYDLILANILARPLMAMARDLARLLAPRGTLVLSGLLAHQAGPLAARYRAAGLALERRLVIDGWATLVLRSRDGRPVRR